MIQHRTKKYMHELPPIKEKYEKQNYMLHSEAAAAVAAEPNYMLHS